MGAVKLPARMCPTGGILDAFTQFVVSRIAVTLQNPFEPTQELLRTRPGSTHLKLKNHRPARPAKLPHESLMITPADLGTLAGDLGLVGLDIFTSHQIGLERWHQCLD